MVLVHRLRIPTHHSPSTPLLSSRWTAPYLWFRKSISDGQGAWPTPQPTWAPFWPVFLEVEYLRSKLASTTYYLRTQRSRSFTTSSFYLPTTTYLLLNTDLLPTTCYLLPTTYYLLLLPTTYYCVTLNRCLALLELEHAQTIQTWGAGDSRWCGLWGWLMLQGCGRSRVQPVSLLCRQWAWLKQVVSSL